MSLFHLFILFILFPLLIDVSVPNSVDKRKALQCSDIILM